MLIKFLNDDLFFLLNLLIKLIILIIIITKFKWLLNLSHPYKNCIYNKNISNNYNFSSKIENVSNINDIFLNVMNINYTYSQEFQIIEIKYFILLYDKNNDIIKPSDLSLKYDLHLVCDIFIVKNNKNIYSLANIYKNEMYFCVEYINIFEQVKFGITIYKIFDDNLEYFEHFFFDQSIILNKNKLDPKFQNNNKFNINNIYNNYNQLILTKDFKEIFKLKSSYLKPPLCYYKRDIALVEGRWYFNNIFENYFCFCKGEYCLYKMLINNYISQSCKYFFYLTIIDNNRNLSIKSHYLLSDFFNAKIESSDALPLFKEMIKENLNAHYVTMSPQIYNQFCSNIENCKNNLLIIYGVSKINGDVLEKYLELILKLKAVIIVDPYKSIDDLFYNIEYITYIFFGHGVQYIKSYLYRNYLSYKKFNKILLPPCEKIIKTALEGGWKIENIIQIGLPKWDNYMIYKNNNLFNATIEKSIFLMFTWRKVKSGKNISDLYINNLYNILKNKKIRGQLKKKNIKIFFCYHHRLNFKNQIKNNYYIKFIKQTDISTLLKNSSLIITDFSAIMFDAIIQKKPLILYIPDALDENLKDLYVSSYYETIYKLKNGLINLYEIFFDIKKVIQKILYYRFVHNSVI